MVKSRTKDAILQRHVVNDLLLAPTLMPIGSTPKDISADQPTMPLDPAIVDYVNERLQAGETHYVPVPGMPALRQALADHMQATGFSGIETANVLVTAGMQEARFLSIQTLGNLLGPVALPEVVHPGARKALGIRPLEATYPLPTEREAGFLPTIDGIGEALESGAKVLFLESPVRLTGAAFAAAAVAEIARLAVQYEAAVIWDQGMAPWVDGYRSIWHEPGMDEQAVLVGEAFPGVGLEPLYIGCIASNPDWCNKITRDKQAISICTSTIDQLCAIKVAELFPELHDAQYQTLAPLHQQAVEGLNGKRLVGDSVNLVAVELSEIMTAPTLRRNGLGFADGADFGVRGVIRLSVTPDNAIADALQLLN
ncbi:MAG: aminotransferase class I/II-fold pyridoxal phosphate-dependent enzyme [Chloroflexi bacterium]|nr:aminotransferase class I/II-fold pyridoxal phosphate-dependent enzyme [Chloroflexota bacterium]